MRSGESGRRAGGRQRLWHNRDCHESRRQGGAAGLRYLLGRRTGRPRRTESQIGRADQNPGQEGCEIQGRQQPRKQFEIISQQAK